MSSKVKQDVLTVTADSCADLKLLRKLETLGYISITVVNLENGKQNKIKQKVGPVAVWNKSNWGDGSVWGSKGNIYQEVLKVLGMENYQDARHLEAHYRTGNDIFVTEDKRDILNNKETLKLKFGIVVMSPQELRSLCFGEATTV